MRYWYEEDSNMPIRDKENRDENYNECNRKIETNGSDEPDNT